MLLPGPLTLPVPPPAAAQVPSALRKFVVPPPEAGTTPCRVELKTFKNAVTCVAVNAMGVAGDPVLLPMIEFAAKFAICAKPTAPFAIVAVAAPDPLVVTCPVRDVIGAFPFEAAVNLPVASTVIPA